MSFAAVAPLLAMALQATPLAAEPPARDATSDECAVALETLRQFRSTPNHVFVRDRRGYVVLLDRCTGGGPRTTQQAELLTIEVDAERGAATAVYGLCQNWYVTLTRREGSWLASPVETIEDACGELGDTPRRRKR